MKWVLKLKNKPYNMENKIKNHERASMKMTLLEVMVFTLIKLCSVQLNICYESIAVPWAF